MLFIVTCLCFPERACSQIAVLLSSLSAVSENLGQFTSVCWSLLSESKVGVFNGFFMCDYIEPSLCRLVHTFTCAGVLQTQYTKLCLFAGLGNVKNACIKQGLSCIVVFSVNHTSLALHASVGICRPWVTCCWGFDAGCCGGNSLTSRLWGQKQGKDLAVSSVHVHVGTCMHKIPVKYMYLVSLSSGLLLMPGMTPQPMPTTPQSLACPEGAQRLSQCVQYLIFFLHTQHTEDSRNFHYLPDRPLSATDQRSGLYKGSSTSSNRSRWQYSDQQACIYMYMYLPCNILFACPCAHMYM